MEPPVLVKLEKEIELEESLMMTDHSSPVKTFTVCCQHGALYHAVSITHIKPPTFTEFELKHRLGLFIVCILCIKWQISLCMHYPDNTWKMCSIQQRTLCL